MATVKHMKTVVLFHNTVLPPIWLQAYNSSKSGTDNQWDKHPNESTTGNCGYLFAHTLQCELISHNCDDMKNTKYTTVN